MLAVAMNDVGVRTTPSARVRDAGTVTGLGAVSRTGASQPPRPGGYSVVGGLPLAAVAPAQLRVALGILAGFGAATAALLPVAAAHGPALAGFVPAYQTAVLLFYALSFLHLVAHVRRSGATPLLHIAAGCLFSALILLIQMFSFPIWGTTQLVGSTGATTSWLWTFWHIGPTLFTFSYITARRPGTAMPSKPGQANRRVITLAIFAAVALVGAATAVSTWALPWLPTIVVGDDYRMLMTSGVGPAVLAATLVSLGLLVLRTRCSTAVELCLAVSLALLAMDDVLTLLGGSRLSLGWYAGRAEAAASGAILLGLYLLEINRRFVVVSLHAELLLTDQTMLIERAKTQIAANAALAVLARQDGLTGLSNRRHLDEVIGIDWRRSGREQQSMSLLMIDVDHFKKFNDRYGHPAGDTCLRSIAGVLNAVARRPGDTAARYGGEEFVLLLPATDAAGAIEMAAGVREGVHALALEHAGSALGQVTLSIGIATAVPGPGDAVADLMAQADRGLYRAKAAGRDRACWADDRVLPEDGQLLAALARAAA